MQEFYCYFCLACDWASLWTLSACGDICARSKVPPPYCHLSFDLSYAGIANRNGLFDRWFADAIIFCSSRFVSLTCSFCAQYTHCHRRHHHHHRSRCSNFPPNDISRIIHFMCLVVYASYFENKLNYFFPYYTFGTLEFICSLVALFFFLSRYIEKSQHWIATPEKKHQIYYSSHFVWEKETITKLMH